MFKRILGTGVALAAAVAAFLVLDCASTGLVFDGAATACTSTEFLIFGSSWLTVVVFGCIAIGLLVITWLPGLAAARRERLAVKSFVDNLERIEDIVPLGKAGMADTFYPSRQYEYEDDDEDAFGDDYEEPDTPSSVLEEVPSPRETVNSNAGPSLVDAMYRAIERFRTVLLSEEASAHDVTRTWIRLLREANRLHNEGRIPTDDFKVINTRLLGVFDDPEETPDPQPAKREQVLQG